MNTKRLAQALNTIAVGFAEAAEALTDDAPAAKTSVEQVPLPSFDELPPYEGAVPPDQELPPNLGNVSSEFAVAPTGEGHLTVCPKHRTPYRDGRFGKFCASMTDDAAWGKERDGKLWCRITPNNADQWLRMQTAA